MIDCHLARRRESFFKPCVERKGATELRAVNDEALAVQGGGTRYRPVMPPCSEPGIQRGPNKQL